MHKSLQRYLEKQHLPEKLIADAPEANLLLAVLIPALNEPNIFTTLNSLKACHKATSPSEVLVLINHSESSPSHIKQQNIKIYHEVSAWAQANSTSHLQFYPLLKGDLPEKYAGAGLARKTLMDEAVSRFSRLGNERGILVSLDADTRVSKNYLTDIQQAFVKDKRLSCALFSFEHDITPELSPENKIAMCLYEIYLRYYKQALQYTGFPYPYYTIGSCFAVTAQAYAKQGGMNRKKAGEDFYFLQKMFALGGTRELNHIWVYPSARISDRVPFGTGPAIQKIIDEGDFLSYRFEYFQFLRDLFKQIHLLYRADWVQIEAVFQKLHPSLQEFMGQVEMQNKVMEINRNCASEKAFVQRFFLWFDAFKIIKYLNFIHLRVNKIPIKDAAITLLQTTGIMCSGAVTEEELLMKYRKLQ